MANDNLVFTTNATTVTIEGTPYPVFRAGITAEDSISDIGGQVQTAAGASTLPAIRAIDTPALSVSGKVSNLWLILKDNASFAIVVDLEEAVTIIDPDAADTNLISKMIGTKVSLKLKRILYSHNLDLGAAEDIFGTGDTVPRVNWPEDFGAGMIGDFAFSLGNSETSFSLKYAVYQYDSDGKVVADPNQSGGGTDEAEEEESGAPDAGNNDAEGEGSGESDAGSDDAAEEASGESDAGSDDTADPDEEKGKPQGKDLGIKENSPVFKLDSVLATYRGMGLNIRIDGTVAVGPLSGKLIQFELDVDLTKINTPADGLITVGLHGVGIGYESPPVTVAGALIWDEEGLNGGLAIGLTAWSMVAIGAISKVEIDGREMPSIFLYGYLGGELVNIEGILALTGIAATMGFNRELTAPHNVMDLPDHPLIKAASASPEEPIKLDDLTDMLENLGEVVPPKAGSFFVGIGLKGTLVELVGLYLLPVVTVKLNFDDSPPSLEDIVIQLFGLASAGLPQEAPILELEVAVGGSFSILDEEILIGAALTENSGLKVTPNLKLPLSGGAAFYFGPSGTGSEKVHLFTIGGYGSLVKPDPRWPIVDPITLSWKPTEDIHIEAGFYFAILPKCFALGFGIKGSAEYKGLGFKAGTSLDLGFDCILQWAPWYYEAEIHANFHAYVQSTIKADSAKKKFDIQAQARIWGPSGQKVSGSAELSIHVLFTFHFKINWGDAASSISSVSWDEFNNKFVPKGSNRQPALTSVKLQQGMADLAEDAGGTKHTVVHPAALEMVTECFFPPAVGILLNDYPVPDSEASNVGIQMMGYTTGDYRNNIQSDLRVSIKKDGTELMVTETEGKLALKSGDSVVMLIEQDLLIRKAVPAALWKPAAAPNAVPAIDPDSPDLLPDVTKGLLIKAVPPIPGTTLEIDKANLEFEISEGKDIETPAAAAIPIGTRQSETAVTEAMTDALPETSVLAALGITESPDFAKLKNTDLQAVPYLV